MKINPLDRTAINQHVAGKISSGQGDFKNVLDQVATPKSTGTSGATPSNPILSPAIVPASVFNAPAYQGAERVLDALERYQKLLADPRSSLRAIDPALQQVKHEVQKLEPLLAEIMDDDPLKPAASEIIMTAVKEISRYESGEYV